MGALARPLAGGALRARAAARRAAARMATALCASKKG